LTALYERCCPPSDRVTHLDILRQGGSSWLHAVYERQREVYDEMYDYRCRLFELLADGKIPVLFGTHETMRQHANEGTTRIFYAPDFGDRWFDRLAKEERSKLKSDLLRGNRVHRVIVDEVSAHDLTTIHRADLVEWTNGCAKDIGFDHTEDVAERYRNFSTHLSENPCKNMTWNVFLDILGCEYRGEHVVGVSDREVPFDDTVGIYGKMVGQRYYVRPRGWWNQFWRVTMLTTEAIPTRMIAAIDAESASRGEEQDDRFKVYEFALPDSARDTVTMELQRACKKETLPELIRAYRAQYPGAEIISDMVRNQLSDLDITTHMSAKGSNAYIDSDVLAFYNALSPALFAELGALNTMFGRSDLVRLFYVDRFEQTCGRNRGFRAAQNREHIAVFPPRLNNWLAPVMSSASYVRVHAKSSVELTLRIDRVDECEVNGLSSACADDGLQ
jgi:hypothetical protein